MQILTLQITSTVFEERQSYMYFNKVIFLISLKVALMIRKKLFNTNFIEENLFYFELSSNLKNGFIVEQFINREKQKKKSTLEQSDTIDFIAIRYFTRSVTVLFSTSIIPIWLRKQFFNRTDTKLYLRVPLYAIFFNLSIFKVNRQELEFLKLFLRSRVA